MYIHCEKPRKLLSHLLLLFLLLLLYFRPYLNSSPTATTALFLRWMSIIFHLNRTFRCRRRCRHRLDDCVITISGAINIHIRPCSFSVFGCQRGTFPSPCLIYCRYSCQAVYRYLLGDSRGNEMAEADCVDPAAPKGHAREYLLPSTHFHALGDTHQKLIISIIFGIAHWTCHSEAPWNGNGWLVVSINYVLGTVEP